MVAAGGYVTGAVAPPLAEATPTQIAEAVRIGPYVMPVFDERQVSNRQLDSIIRYVEYTKNPDDRGGWSLAHVGPVPEGLVTWFLAASALVAVCLVAREEAPWLSEGMADRGDRPAARAQARTPERRRVQRVVEPRRRIRARSSSCSPCSACRRSARSASSSSTRSTAYPRRRSSSGLTLGFALLALAAALIVAGKALVPEEELVEPYAPDQHPNEQEAVTQIVEEGTGSLTRGRLLKLALLGSVGTLGAAALVPAASFGPLLRVKTFFGTPWRRGRRLVDEAGRPLRADEIREGSFYHAFPEGADKEEQGSPLVVVRLREDALALPGELAGFDADGIVAYSAICTHAGCAISMYRAPLFRPADPRPALVCPCHYSTFDPANGGTVLFGPAGRQPADAAARDRRQGVPAREGELQRRRRPVVVGRAEPEAEP